MKVRTSELTGAALDWAVALIEGNEITFNGDWPSGMWGKYSANWSQGGPIIERERITVYYDRPDDTWTAWPAADMNAKRCESGATPLIAAMRCYVASKLGGVVEVPEELI